MSADDNTPVEQAPAPAPPLVRAAIGAPTLFRKLAEVMGEAERVPKRGTNPHHKYKYAQASDVMDAVRAGLASRGVALLPEITSVAPGMERKTSGGNLTYLWRVDLTYTFADAETGETWAVPWTSFGEDPGDKGVAKALTIGVKTMLLQTFLMSTGDDPEGNGDEGRPTARRSRQSSAGQPAQAPGEGEVDGEVDDPYKSLVDDYSDLGEQAAKDALKAVLGANARKKREIRGRDSEVRALLDANRAEVQATRAPTPVEPAVPANPPAPAPPTPAPTPSAAPKGGELDQPIAPKQVELIDSLAKRLEAVSPGHPWRDYVQDQSLERAGVVVSHLTVQQASELISHLQSVLRTPPAPAGAPAGDGS